MAIDISDLVHGLGLNPKSFTNTNQKLTTSVSNQGGKAAKPAKGASAIISGAAKMAGNAASGLLNSTAKSFTNTASGITQGLPGIGSIAQKQHANDAMRRQIDMSHKAYTRDFASGKITKDRYNKLLRELGKQYEGVSGEAKENAKTVKPVDFATSLATVATAPLAAGRLVSPGLAAKAPMLASTTSRGAASAALLAPAKSALMYAPTAKATAEIPGQVQRGDYKGAAMNAGLLASPIAIAGAAKILPKLGKAVSEATYGKASFLDDIPTKDTKITKFIGTLQGKAKEQYETIAKQFQEYNLGQTKGSVQGATAKYLDWVGPEKAKSLSAKEHLDLFKKFSDDIERTREAARAGTLPKPGGGTWTEDEIQNLWVGRFDQTVKSKLIDRLKTIEDPKERAQVAAKAASSEQWGSNELLQGQVIAAAERPDFVKAIGKLQGTRSLAPLSKTEAKIAKIQEGQAPVKSNETLDAVFGKRKELQLNQGHIPILRSKIKTQIPSDVSKVQLEAGKEAGPILGAVGKLLEKSGLSTQSQNPAVYATYKTYLGDELKKVGLDVKDVTDKLNKYSTGLQGFGVSDERQLGTYALKQALGISDSKQANEVRKAIFKAYDRMTFGDLSLAGKIENALYKVPGYGGYRRLQGIGRYQGNPFFRLQSSVEAEILSQNLARGKVPTLPGTNNIQQRMFAANADELDSITAKLKSRFSEGFAGEGAADTSYGIITAKLTRSQEKSVSGLVKTLAEKSKYKNVDEFLDNIDPQTLDNIRSVVQYPRQGFTSSNFAKTMNMLVFPSRYNTKLAGIAGKAIVDMPPLMQIGTLKGISDFSTFLTTDEGIKWKSDNAEVIGILSYLNPVGNIGKIIQGIRTGNLQNSISDLGIIGGLPLGVITQIIKSQTGLSFNQPYLNPKTGELVPDKLPDNTAGAIKLLLIDVINSMYSFPGRTFGTNLSKSDLTQSAPGLKLKSSDTKDSERQPNEKQRQIQRVLAKKDATTPEAKVPTLRLATQYGQNKEAFPTIQSSGLAPLKKKKAARVKPKAFRPRPL